jgi:hypothetical protein
MIPFSILEVIASIQVMVVLMKKKKKKTTKKKKLKKRTMLIRTKCGRYLDYC